MPTLVTPTPITYPGTSSAFTGAIVFQDSWIILEIDNGEIVSAKQASGKYAMGVKPIALPLIPQAGKYYLRFISGDIDLILCDLTHICSMPGDYEWIVPSGAFVTLTPQRRNTETDELRARIAERQAQITALELELARLRPLLTGDVEELLHGMTIVSPDCKPNRVAPVTEELGCGTCPPPPEQRGSTGEVIRKLLVLGSSDCTNC